MDEDIKKLFDDFSPELSSDFIFMSELKRKMESVEIVREHYAQRKHYNKLAVIIAALAGFIVGIAFSYLIPYIGIAAGNLLSSVPKNSGYTALVANYQIVLWLIIAATSVFTAIGTYDFSFALLNRNEPKC